MDNLKEGDCIKKVNALLRVLSGVIDLIIVMIPVQLVMMGIFHVSVRQADLLFKLLFAVYGVLFIEYMNGATPGKYIGKIKVLDKAGVKPTILYVGLRELSKSLYFIPYLGWGLGIVSIAMILFGSGRAIHDHIGNTVVTYVWEKGCELHDDGI